MVECFFTNYVVVGSDLVAVTYGIEQFLQLFNILISQSRVR